MSTDVMALPRTSRLFWLRRARSWFSGTGYMLTVTLALVASWSLEEVVVETFKSAPSLNAIHLLHTYIAAMTGLGSILLLPVPAIVLLLNLAPRTGGWRVAWLSMVVLLMGAWCSGSDVVRSHELSAFAYLVESLLTAALLVAAWTYRSSARSAADALLHRRIGSETLDAELKQARLQLLRAQVEPHFLFNTLATVHTLARIDRPAAVEMIDNLLRYLAEALPKLRQDESLLVEELRLIDAYLRIHQVRMGTRLAYELAVPSELGGERIPTMMLLTLVENALKHGINPAVEGGFIRVSAMRERSALVLKVADSGRGLAAQQGHGTGLANVRLRLMMLYGDKAILSLARAESRGVVATVSIPIQARA